MTIKNEEGLVLKDKAHIITILEPTNQTGHLQPHISHHIYMFLKLNKSSSIMLSYIYAYNAQVIKLNSMYKQKP